MNLLNYGRVERRSPPKRQAAFGPLFQCSKTSPLMLASSRTEFIIRPNMHWNWWLNFSTVFRDIAVGIGALLGGFGGLRIFIDWLKLRIEKRAISRWKRLISPSRVNNKEVELVQASGQNEIYAVDKATDSLTNTMWWVRNPSTLHDLGFQRATKQISVDKLETLKHERYTGTQVNFYL
jgi:hypothetical protein